MATENNEGALDALASLDIKELLTYVALIGKGPLTLDEVSLYSDQPVENTRTSLDGLAKKGLITALSQMVKSFSATQPYHHLAEQLELMRSSNGRIRESVANSSRLQLDATGKELTSLIDLVRAHGVELAAALEDIVAGDVKRFEKARVESIDSLNEKIRTLRKELDETVKEANTRIEANLGETKTAIDDAAKDFGKDISTSTSRDVIEPNIRQLSVSIETFKALLSKLAESVTRGYDGLTKQTSGFKSTVATQLARFDKTGKTIETVFKAADSSLQTTLKQIKSRLSDVEESWIEAIGTESGTHKKKLSAQAIFMDSQSNTVSNFAKALDQVALAHAETVKKAQKLANELLLDTKAHIEELLHTKLDPTVADSRTAKRLEKRVESLRNETTRMADVLTQEMENVITKSDEFAGIQAGLLASLGSFAGNIHGNVGNVLRDFRQDDNIINIKKQVTEIEDYSRQVSNAHDSFQADLQKFAEGIIGQLDRFEEKHNSSVSKTISRLAEAIKQIHERNIDLPDLPDLTELLASENKELGQLKEETNSKVDLIVAGISGSSKRSAAETIKASQRIVTQLKEGTEMLPGKVETLFQSAADEVDRVIAAARDEMEGVKVKGVELNGIMKETKTRTRTAIEKQFKLAERLLETIKEETAKDVSTVIQKIETDFDETVKILKGHLAEGTTILDGVLEAQRTSISALSIAVKEKLLESLGEARESLKSTMEKATDLTTKTIGETRNLISESGSGMLGEFDSAVSTILEKLTALTDENNGMIERQKIQCCGEIEAACTQLTDKAVSEILGMINLLRNALNRTETTLTEKTTSIFAKVSSIATELTGYTNEQLSNLNEQAKTKSSKAILGSADILSSSLAEIASQQSSSVEKLAKESITVCSNSLVQSLERLRGSLLNLPSTIISPVVPIMDEAEHIVSTNAKMLTRISEFLDKLANVPAPEKTWHLLSKRSIIEHLGSMVQRARGTVFIDAPALSYLPSAKEFGKKKEVMFFVQVGGTRETDSEYGNGEMGTESGNRLESIKMLSNVRLIVKEATPYIVVTRDNAEILVGVENQGDRKVDATAIASEETAYINLVKEVIGPQVLSET